ncbi:hypothetical protein RJ640_024879 [Escallonia rubra]|uniref:Uncharacterized protein n=1 Tax=Escallonia rubra TaxID=112253 RepID=A0AA88RWC5_9ASTE|nr:hypothetical protein RJ640_024879 [Escallonia rubra]
MMFAQLCKLVCGDSDCGLTIPVESNGVTTISTDKVPTKQQDPQIATGSSSSSDDDDDPSLPQPEKIQKLLKPYTLDHLVGFLIDAANWDPSILARVRPAANRDVSHCKIFVHGLGWDSTRETLAAAFEPFGAIED